MSAIAVSHHATKAFWEGFDRLPPEIQTLARKNFRLMKRNPGHPSLSFKKVGRFWSVRVGRSYRALAVVRDQDCVWFWIGPHDEYERLISS